MKKKKKSDKLRNHRFFFVCVSAGMLFQTYFAVLYRLAIKEKTFVLEGDTSSSSSSKKAKKEGKSSRRGGIPSSVGDLNSHSSFYWLSKSL